MCVHSWTTLISFLCVYFLVGLAGVEPGKFTVFHSQGLTAYNPENCLKQHSIHADFGSFKFIPDQVDNPLRLCSAGKDCSWGAVVNVKDTFLYASQPDDNRLVVVETDKQWVPVQVCVRFLCLLFFSFFFKYFFYVMYANNTFFLKLWLIKCVSLANKVCVCICKFVSIIWGFGLVVRVVDLLANDPARLNF
jgi:hypothetical protein